MMNTPEVLFDGSCGCGWLLPDSVMAFPLGKPPSEGGEQRGVYVALRCPICTRGHSFYNGEDPASVAEAMTVAGGGSG